MKIAILGGGIAGVSAAYELAKMRSAGAAVEATLFETSHRLGGIVETHREGGFVIECGPDSWVTEKPWARELALELGLADEIIPSNDRWRRTYVLQGNQLVPMPDGMRMMVPSDWAPMLSSPLFSAQAKLAYLGEPKRAEELKAAALAESKDESVSDFVQRHFGPEVTTKLAAPLLAGVFGGDITQLSVRAVMPTFVAMEREHGSLIRAIQQGARTATSKASVFTSLKSGLGTLIERMASTLPNHWVRLHDPVLRIERAGDGWSIRTNNPAEDFDAVIVATPASVSRTLLQPLDARIAELLQMEASSAIIVAMAFTPEQALKMRIPRGFGFLVPQQKHTPGQNALLAVTFVDQKFSHRAPEGGVLLRAFFGGATASQRMHASDETLIALARKELGRVLGVLPEAQITLVRRWPNSLPQYKVGHLDRIAELEQRAAAIPGLRLIGNAYHGVGLPDLIREGRTAARSLRSI
ncbi:MAG: protoporphyrinogen oxidase [Acidobacteriaceae bacterium]